MEHSSTRRERRREILATLFDNSGDRIDQETIFFDGHQARFFEELFQGVSGDFLGYVQLQASNWFFVTVLRQELIKGGFQLTSVPAQHVF